MKAQAQIVSIILVIGAIIVLTGVTYFWGKPLIDKRVIITQISTLKDFAENIDDKITDMAKTCRGFCDETLTIPPGVHMMVYSYNSPESDNNSILVEFAIDYMMMGNEPVPLNTNILGEVAPYGETNGVITMKQVMKGQQYLIIFKLHYRELDTKALPYEGYKIILEPGGLAGQQKITISFVGTSITPGGAANGGPLTTAKINIETF